MLELGLGWGKAGACMGRSGWGLLFRICRAGACWVYTSPGVYSFVLDACKRLVTLTHATRAMLDP